MSETKKRSLVGIAGIVAIATMLSKVAGLVRQVAIAAFFGVGPAYDAYNYAYVIPGFLLILLGGINGPFHSAIVSVLAKRKKEEAAPLVETITTAVGGILLLATIALIIFAEPLLNLVAPGLGRTPEGLVIQKIAIEQSRIMAPMALLAGLIGIGFGTLNAADMYWLPSISPLFSSVALLVGLAGFFVVVGGQVTDPQHVFLGGLVLAYGTLGGAVLQWLIQVPAQWKAGLGTLRLRFNFRDPGVQDVIKIMGPATLSSGMMYINVQTALFFASFIPQAASAMGYATLLIQTPLGIVSNVILVPLLPVFSRLANPEDWPELKQRIRQGLVMTAVTMLPLSAIFSALALPIVELVYKRGAFGDRDVIFVAQVMVAYAIGMFAYLGRDVLVRVFYALGDGETPFRISVVNIFLNAVLDAILIFPLGTPGLVLATVIVNITSMLALMWYLDRKIHGLPWREWGLIVFQMTLVSVVAGCVSAGTFWVCQQSLNQTNFLIQLVQLCVAGTAGLVVFGGIATACQLPGTTPLMDLLRRKLPRQLGGRREDD
ncbi:murein biosynthesis integral membrane protein MurJ [Leptolyngbya sp. 'hensonii']|uniref:murein biosynthesis integral membrane protein MurJ n=1 Tax=Leptolyngbya sp. 'hensonii' TaxID=1922337 RepID=UPI00094F8BA6|nr:murein biosynthesis integral membrane protein MurJ [Leptolyngbya sp. 'hensonii']OLP19629.1 murein biosynthesis integral membrane protein MurJ [Leptolyngbya sp. 'hensonii']